MKSVKSPWEYKASKRAEEAQGKQMGQGCPREKGTQEPIGKKAHGSVKPLGKEYMADPKRGPAGSSHYSRNDRTLWQNMMASKKWAGRNVKPSIKGSPIPKVGKEL